MRNIVSKKGLEGMADKFSLRSVARLLVIVAGNYRKPD